MADREVRVRVLRPFVSPLCGAAMPGRVLYVPAPYLDSWLRAGLVEQDKSLDSAPETK